MKFPQLSLNARLLLIVSASIVTGFLVVAGVFHFIKDLGLALILGAPISLTISFYLIMRQTKAIYQRINGLRSGLYNLIDNEFGVSLTNEYEDEIGELLGLYNRVTEKMRQERQHLYQRELLLDTVIQNSSLYLILTNDHGRIIYSSHQARSLINAGKPINGLVLQDILAQGSERLKHALSNPRDGLFTLGDAGSHESFHLSRSNFTLNAQVHQLILIKQMTRELNRQETQIWKKVIRIITHELNNSLAPISSVAHSGALMLEQGKIDNLERVFETISNRASHLAQFIEQYATMAKLPAPNKVDVEWASFIKGLAIGYSYEIHGELPVEKAFFDPTQLQQVVVNLLKNANESGSEPADIGLRITQNSKAMNIVVTDRGTGMPKNVVEQALLPFYTTKPNGSGIGLPLCREIVEAHDGELSYANREGGGLMVRIYLPLVGV
ncbi:MAG: histidine kinase [Alteromonadaceae bacterium]|nr:MAG: histidine kinase [Alteromonadaceae bacterium]